MDLFEHYFENYLQYCQIVRTIQITYFTLSLGEHTPVGLIYKRQAY